MDITIKTRKRLQLENVK